MTPRSESLSLEADRLVPLVSARLAAVRERISRAGGDADRVSIVAVTKGFGPEVALAAVRSGLGDLGENYDGPLIEKAAALFAEGVEVTWHYLGAIQRRKVAGLSKVVSFWQSLSRPVEALAIARHASARPPRAFVEVNLAGEERRPGCLPADAAALVVEARQAGIEVAGLMAVAPLGGPGVTERAFAEAAELRADLGLGELSLGMSGDLEAAVRAGTTMIRVGTALFGPRDPRVDR